MARRNHDEQVDPFNASDPVMPLDDVSAAHDDSDCNFDGSPYEAPKTKKSRLIENFKLQPSPVDEEDELDDDGELGGENGEFDDEYDDTDDEFEDDDEDGESKAKPRKAITSHTIKFIVIVIVIFSLAASFFGLVATFIERVFDNSGSTSAVERNYSELIDELQNRGYDVEAWTGSGEDDDDAAAEAYITMVVDDRLSALKNDDNLRQMIIDDFDYKFEQTYGFTPAAAGCDSSTYADKVLNTYTYEINSVYAYADEGDGYVYSYLNAYQYWDFGNVFEDLAWQYLSDNSLMYTDGSSFTVEQKSQIKSYFDEAVNAEWEMQEGYISFDFTLEGDVWSVDEDKYQEEIENAFSLYYNTSYYKEYMAAQANALTAEGKSA